MTDPVFQRIAIIGAGLIGSSIARAAREYGMAGEIILYDASADVRARAVEIGGVRRRLRDPLRAGGRTG